MEKVENCKHSDLKTIGVMSSFRSCYGGGFQVVYECQTCFKFKVVSKYSVDRFD